MRGVDEPARLSEVLEAQQPLRTRLCYLSGFPYYLHTALFTFVAPLIPLLCDLRSEAVRLRNYVWILPGIVYYSCCSRAGTDSVTGSKLGR